MRRLAWLLALLALPALAEDPSDFSGSARITPSGGDALQRFTMPFEVYRDARRDLADVRVFNARGEPVPIAMAGEPETVREAAVTVELPQFPVSSMAPATATAAARGAEVTIRTADGMLVSVKGGGGRTNVPDTTRTVAYVLDASQVKDPLRAMIFQWDAAPGSEVVCVSVDSSDDLQSWRGAGRGSLVRLEQGGRVLEQPRIAIGPLKAKYFRVTWCGPKFALKGVKGEFEPTIKPPERTKLTVQAHAGEKPGEYVVDLGARLPVEQLRVVPAETNSVAVFNIATRDVPEEAWRNVTSSAFYRLVRDGAEVQSPPRDVGRFIGRYWLIRVDPQSGGLGRTPPALEVSYRPDQVVFVARGEAPFALAWGDPEAKSAWVPVSSLIPSYKMRDELKLPAAGVSDVKSEGPPHGNWPGWAARMGPRKLTLWAVLALSVLVLGGIAWTLHRQMKNPAPAPTPPSADR